jgi:hypothetical protein
VNLDQFIAWATGRAIIITHMVTAECVAVFWAFNRLVGKSETYAAPGAVNLWTTTGGQPYLWDSYHRITSGYQRGDFLIWSGTTGAYPNGGFGHVAMLLKLYGDGTGDFLTQNPGNTAVRRLKLDGVVGALRYKHMPSQAPQVAMRTVTQNVAYARTEPRSDAPLAPNYPLGLARGAQLAIIGYVAGQDPYGTGDNAWYKTKSGYYVWANAAGNNLAGLRKL